MNETPMSPEEQTPVTLPDPIPTVSGDSQPITQTVEPTVSEEPITEKPVAEEPASEVPAPEEPTDALLKEQSSAPILPEVPSAETTSSEDSAVEPSDQQSPITAPAFQQTAPPLTNPSPMAPPVSQYGNYTNPAPALQPNEPNTVPMQSRILLILLFVAIVAFSVFCIVWDIRKGSQSGGYVAGDITEIHIGQQHKPETNDAYMDENGKYTIEGIAATVMPSIVEIYTYSDSKTIGSGSGILLSEDGYLVTNAHVVIGGNSFAVTLHDERTVDGICVGYDSKTDIAVLKINADHLTPAVLGNSDETVLGEQVCALGNPAGLTGSISTGIISGLHRKVRAESNTFEMDCLQTDAAISPGNSGGALVNLYGQVIGITSSKYVAGGLFEASPYEGLGFAITINEALPIIKELISQGYVSGRVRVGIQFYESSIIEAATGLTLPDELKEKGIYIMAIDEDAPIADTALEAGDFIVEMNGIPVADYADLDAALKDKRGGDTVTARCARIGKDEKITYFEIEILLLEDTSGDY
ncbi:MAG: trypsin-like peptidase domain-containing protein [Oscillospiraceae bacterium]|nr:trypsin-like peptidase domain-containing protein [Oscillospiraceae bacterium]